jgi:hypothetical protein
MFSLGNLLGVVLCFYVEDLSTQLNILSGYCLITALLHLTTETTSLLPSSQSPLLPLDDTHPSPTPFLSSEEDIRKITSLEILTALMLFLLIGSNDSFLFLWKLFLREELQMTNKQSTFLLLLYLLSSTSGKIFGTYLRNRITHGRFYLFYLLFLLLGTTSSILLIPQLLLMTAPPLASSSLPSLSPLQSPFYLALTFFGLCQGPMISLVFDIYLHFQKPTHLSEQSIHRLIISLHLGITILPSLTCLLWNSLSLISMVGISSLSCLPLLWYLSATCLDDHRNGYSTIPDTATGA